MEEVGREKVDFFAFPSAFLYAIRHSEGYSLVFLEASVDTEVKGNGKKRKVKLVCPEIEYVKQTRLRKYNPLNANIPICVVGHKMYRDSFLKAGASKYICTSGDTWVFWQKDIREILAKYGVSFKKKVRRKVGLANRSESLI